jgi:hypothetical protein
MGINIFSIFACSCVCLFFFFYPCQHGVQGRIGFLQGFSLQRELFISRNSRLAAI